MLYLKPNSLIVEVGPGFAHSFISPGCNLENWSIMLIGHAGSLSKFQSKHDPTMFFYARPSDIGYLKS